MDPAGHTPGTHIKPENVASLCVCVMRRQQYRKYPVNFGNIGSVCPAESFKAAGKPGLLAGRGGLSGGRCGGFRTESRVRLGAQASALHCTALHCTALHCTALHCVSSRGRRPRHQKTNKRRRLGNIAPGCSLYSAAFHCRQIRPGASRGQCKYNECSRNLCSTALKCRLNSS
jgi:hypothetical protein